MTNRFAEEPALCAEVQQVGAKFLAHPERAVIHARDRLDIEVRASQQPAGLYGRIDRNLRSGRVVICAVINRSVRDVRRIEEALRIAERCEAEYSNWSARRGAIS